MSSRLRVTLLAGGVGGAKMAEGLAALDRVDLTVIGNIADDDEFHGLWVSPDIDTLTYTLSGQIDRNQGWGVANEGHRALEVLSRLGQDCWMSLGDRDLGLHIWRTMRRRRGDRPSQIAADAAQAFGVRPKLVLPTDDIVKTMVRTNSGWLSFQEYFVREKCAPDVLELRFDGLDQARATREALDAIGDADIIVFAPSNPLVSIGPILGIAQIRESLRSTAAPKIAVSPFIAGKVVKGPADRMMASLGRRADALGVSELYCDLIGHMVIDRQDADLAPQIESLGLSASLHDILMRDQADKARLADEVVAIAEAALATHAKTSQ